MFRRTYYQQQRDASRPGPKRHPLPARLTALAGYGYLAVTLFAQLAGFLWPADLFSNFTLQYLLAGILLALVLLCLRRYLFAGLVLLLALYQFVPLLNAWDASPEPTATRQEDSKLTIVQHNIAHFNADRPGLIKALIRESADADIIVLFEVSQRWLWFLKPLKLIFPNSLIMSQERSFGMAVFAKSKDITLEPLTLYSGYKIAVMHGHTKNQTPYAVFAAHPPSPYNLMRWTDRNTMLIELAHRIHDDKTPNHILLGDLNITPYSPWYDTLESDGGLHLARQQNLANLGTWPDDMPSWLRIPLDHRLVSPGIQVEATPLQGYGSDHIMIRSTYWLPLLTAPLPANK